MPIAHLPTVAHTTACMVLSTPATMPIVFCITSQGSTVATLHKVVPLQSEWKLPTSTYKNWNKKQLSSAMSGLDTWHTMHVAQVRVQGQNYILKTSIAWLQKNTTA